ncbi:prolipoprotein diacylglyceryl transferase [Rickettsiales bacterium]|nr:prolipoprotein diacylglyceryl transferase [Rickettsiales bacterium]
MILPIFDPVIFSIGPLAVRWYSLAYILGIVFTYYVLKKSKILDDKAMDSWLSWSIIGIILGGRLGYVLFYNFAFYLQNPIEIFYIWRGGMSFHGGLFGAIISMFLFAKKYKINFLELTDILSIAAPIGLFFGRIANFINMELYGRVTDSVFGVVFPLISYQKRHPSQLYEAFLEGILCFIILNLLAKFTQIKEKKGALSGLFLIIYASSRIFVEQFREPDQHIGFIFNYFTMGQLLSLPILFLGLFVFCLVSLRSNHNSHL